MSVPAPAVFVQNLRKRYGAVAAVDGVTFDVQPGEVFGLLGPNGAGKTTTVECVIGLREPDSGDVTVAGIDRRAHPADVKRRIGAALQTTALQDAITTREAVALFAALYGAPEAPETVLKRFGLDALANTRFGVLSGGQQQRLALALAFVSQPAVVVLDEPTAGLDPRSRRELHAEIAAMRESGRAVLLTTHDVDDAEAICDRVAIIARGTIVAMGSPRELVARSGGTPTITLHAQEPLAREQLASVDGVLSVGVDRSKATLKVADVNHAIIGLGRLFESAGVELTDLHVRKATLEDVFIELTGPAS
jgi:ABC-2 type transport system ATP-binding protein